MRVADFNDAPGANTDPRWRRTRQALDAAALELAAAHPIRQISVNELTKRAGVDRSTFYNHAASPDALLQAILTSELEGVYQRFRKEFAANHMSPGELQEQAFREILRHVIARQAIYTSSLHNGDGNLVQSVIGAHFTGAAREMLNENLYPQDPPFKTTAFEREFAARSASAAAVGGIVAWLIQDGELNIDEFIDSFQRFLPNWFTMTSQK